MKMKRYFLKCLSFVPSLLLLFMIFGFSAQEGEASGSLSLQISLALVRLASPLLPASMSEEAMLMRAETIHFLVRKAAHMTEYFLLALSLQLPLSAWFSRLLPYPRRILIGFFCTAIFAALDEFHQTFVPGRSGNFTDVCIDSTGAAIASLFLFLLYTVYRKKQENLE